MPSANRSAGGTTFQAGTRAWLVRLERTRQNLNRCCLHA